MTGDNKVPYSDSSDLLIKTLIQIHHFGTFLFIHRAVGIDVTNPFTPVGGVSLLDFNLVNSHAL